MSDKPTIGITGATGFIGSVLANYLAANGYHVIRFIRNVTSGADVDTRKYDLANPDVSADLFRNIDILIHCAFVTKDQHADAEQVNYSGTKRLVESCRSQGVKKIIFFSSITADEHARSAYAKGKFASHQLFNPDSDLIIRCSLVIGEGGLFGRIIKYATSRSFIPLIGSGKQTIQFIVVEDLAKFVIESIHNERSGICVLASPERVTYKQLFRVIAKVHGRNIIFVPVPIPILKTLLKISRFLRIRMPVSEENLLGFQTIRTINEVVSPAAPITLIRKLEDMRSRQLQSPGKE